MSIEITLIVIIIVALLFDFTNGWNDSANAIATVVSTRVLSPASAVIMASILNFAGAFLSTKVAKTIGGGLVDPSVVTPLVILAAMIAATLWNGSMSLLGMPVSGSHALIGGLIGAVMYAQSVAVIKVHGVLTVLVALLVSPILGLIVGFIFMVSIMWLFRNVSMGKINRRFGRLQIISAGSMAFTHGLNDAQKVMGVITLALFSSGKITSVEVPFWVIFACASMISLGTAIGGWKVIKTLGTGLLSLRPVHGFAAETAAVSVLSLSAWLGVPVSTTHIITSSIMGVGAAKRLSAVRWGIGQKILWAWIFTLPCTMFLAAVVYFVLKIFF